MLNAGLLCIAIGFATVCVGSIGCASRSVKTNISEAVAHELIGQVTDLTVPAAKFRSEKGRWPENLPELGAFVEQSGDRLQSYDRVEFIQLPADAFQILAVSSNGTNRATVTFHQTSSSPR